MANGSATGKKSKVAASLIVGVVLGVVVAGLLAWYMTQKNPASFKVPPVAPEAAKPVPAPAATAPTAPARPAQQFEFYRELPDKADGANKVDRVVKPSAPPAPKVKPSAPATDTTPYFVQAGSFQSAADAEKLKAKLALAGFEATVQSVDLPGKGIWHRVRLGPYRGLAAANETIASLKLNGVANAAAMHAQ